MKTLTAITASVSIFGLIVTSPDSATFTRDGDRLIMRGTIQEGDDAAFAAALDDDVRTVVLDSLGGRVAEAKRIGTAIRERRLDTAIPSSCVSACALIWAGGKTRTVDGRLSVHCPTLIGSPYSCDAPGRQQMIRYLQEMNAPAGVVRMQEATNWMAMTVTPAQLAEAPVAVAQAEEPQPEQVTEDAPRPPRRRPAPRYAAPPLPPPGVLYEPWTQRAVPCLPTLLTLGMVRFCI